MRTPEGSLERVFPPYSTTIYTQPSAVSDEKSTHVISLPNKDDCDNPALSVLRLQHRLSNFTLHKSTSEPVVAVNISPPCQDSSPDSPQPQYDLSQKGWITGVFSCLRPVFSIIGKSTISEIRNVQDDWEIPFEQITDLHYLGYGGQGVVFSGMLNSQPVAVKKVKDIKETDIKNLRKLNHPNVVKFKGVCTQAPCFSIVMEFCPYGPLYNLLKNQKNVVTINRVVSWAKQITSGMHYLHAQKIIHRDLKSPNVLIGEEEIIKISDFGTSRTWNGVSEKMSFAGTVAWMAPEAIQEMECSEKVDVWSFGVVLWELLTCEIPYDGMEQSAIMYLVGIGKLKPPIPKTCPAGFKLIMEMCWKLNPKERPSFKLILNHLQIASVEILGMYEDKQFFKTQESWKEEIKSQITQFKAQLQEHRVEFQLKEEQLIKKRETEIKQIMDIRELYDRKLEKVNQLYLELTGVLQQVEQSYRQGSRKKRIFNPLMRKLERRRSNHSTTPTSPEHSMTSPDSPQPSPAKKAPLYVQLNTSTNQTESVTQTTQTCTKFRKKHYRANSGSPRNSRTTRSLVGVDAETQTEIEISETSDISPVTTSLSLDKIATPLGGSQKVILKELRNESEDEQTNGNSIQLHYLYGEQPAVQVFTRCDSVGHDNALNRNAEPEDTLETLGSKFSALKNRNILSDMRLSRENGNLDGVDLGPDSTEDMCNDSFTDEESEVYNNSLRRRSNARRPIYPGRRLSRQKFSSSHYHKELNASDEGDTSEYSMSPSSRSSTLESNPGANKAGAAVPNQQTKRPNDRSDGLSDSDSEGNMTVVTQISFNMNNKSENVV